MHHTFMLGRASEPQCDVRSGEAEGSCVRQRAATEVPEEAGVEAAMEETGVERWRRPT
jgi:hypothetical protein